MTVNKKYQERRVKLGDIFIIKNFDEFTNHKFADQ